MAQTALGSNSGSCSSPSSTIPIQESPQAAHNPSVGSDKEKSITSQSSLVSIGAGFMALPRRLFEKIGANEYIDFMDLPPARGKPRSLPYHLDGQLLLVQLQDVEDHRRIIPDFPTWIQCFTIYSAALCLQHPQRLPHLLAYQAQMASYAKNSGGRHGSYTTRTTGKKRQPRKTIIGLKLTPLSTHSAS